AAEPYHQLGHLLVSMKGPVAAARANELFAVAAAIDPLNEEALYDTACALSLAGDKKAALDALDRAVKSGFRDFPWMATDKDLDAIRAEPRFETITGGKAKKPPEPTGATGG